MDRFETRTALTIDRNSWNLHRESGGQSGQSGDIAARANCIAEDYVIDIPRVHGGFAQNSSNHLCGEHLGRNLLNIPPYLPMAVRLAATITGMDILTPPFRPANHGWTRVIFCRCSCKGKIRPAKFPSGIYSWPAACGSAP